MMHLRDHLAALALSLEPTAWQGKDPHTLTAAEQTAAVVWIDQHGGTVFGMFGPGTVATAAADRLTVRHYGGVDLDSI